METTPKPKDKRCRSEHPERITIGGEVFERNDVLALAMCMTERALNEDDKRGAPFVYIGNVKYRPRPRYDAFFLTKIRSQKPAQQPKRRRVK